MVTNLWNNFFFFFGVAYPPTLAGKELVYFFTYIILKESVLYGVEGVALDYILVKFL